jgi:hypothetical protein
MRLLASLSRCANANMKTRDCRTKLRVRVREIIFYRIQWWGKGNVNAFQMSQGFYNLTPSIGWYSNPDWRPGLSIKNESPG